MLIFSPSKLSRVLAREYIKHNRKEKIYINIVEPTYLIENEYINYCCLRSLQECQKFIIKNNIRIVVVLSDIHSTAGLVNFFKYNLGIPTFGITKYWCKLESSKFFGKKFMQKYKIPMPEYRVIFNKNDIINAIKDLGLPVVLKDNNLQAGFGSYICKTEKDCFRRANKLLNKYTFFIMEKFINGEEVTIHTLWDGKVLIPLLSVRDYKRLQNRNKGINTGSMGCYTPVKLSIKQQNMIDKYIKNLEFIFKEIKPNFTGIFASDLIFTENKIYNLEFNMRYCTPEFETLIEHLESDIFEIFYKTAFSELTELKIHYKTGRTGAVNIVHEDYKKQKSKLNIKKIKIPKNFFIKENDIKINFNCYKIIPNDQMIVNTNSEIFTIIKNDINNPFPDIYKFILNFDNEHLYYRTDIGDN